MEASIYRALFACYSQFLYKQNSYFHPSRCILEFGRFGYHLLGYSIFYHKYEFTIATLSNSRLLYYNNNSCFLIHRRDLVLSHIKLFANWARLLQSLNAI